MKWCAGKYLTAALETKDMCICICVCFVCVYYKLIDIKDVLQFKNNDKI